METVLQYHYSPYYTGYFFHNFVTQLCNKFQEFNGPFIVTQGRTASFYYVSISAGIQQCV